MPSRNQSEVSEPVKLNMTPMIDVVFQLLIFFLCTMKFKTLDQKLETQLPKDRGVNPSSVPPPVIPTLTVALRRGEGEDATRVRVANATIGVIYASSAVARDPSLAAVNLATLREVARMSVAFRERAGDGAELAKGELDAAPGVPTGDVLRAVDAFRDGGLSNITFIGTPEPK